MEVLFWVNNIGDEHSQAYVKMSVDEYSSMKDKGMEIAYFALGLFLGPFILVLLIIDFAINFPIILSSKYADLFQNGWFLTGGVLGLVLWTGLILWFVNFR